MGALRVSDVGIIQPKSLNSSPIGPLQPSLGPRFESLDRAKKKSKRDRKDGRKEEDATINNKVVGTGGIF